MKQTAVEILRTTISSYENTGIDIEIMRSELLKLIDNEILEIEKQQIIDARVNGVAEGIEISDKTITEDISKNHEIYYNETFKKEIR
jgi:hypothetical protein